MDLQVRTKDGLLTVKITGSLGAFFYEQLNSSPFFKRTTKVFDDITYICFVVVCDTKFYVKGETEIWLHEGWYIKVL